MKRSIVMVGLGAALTAAAPAQTTRVVYSEIAADPTSAVPDGAGVPAGTLFTAFDRPYRSPDGLRWIISAETSLAAAENEIIIVGGGMAGATVVREGTAFGTPTVGETVGLIRRNMGISDVGNYAFGMNSSGPLETDEYIVLFDMFIDGPNSFVTIAREGSMVRGVAGEVYGSTLDAAHILNDNFTVGFRAPSTVGALPTTMDDFLILGAAITAQAGVGAPSGQAGGAAETWEAFDADDFYTDATGAAFIAQGDLTGPTTGDDVIVVNGRVVLQEGSTVPSSGLTSPIATLTEISMDSGGAWYCRGNNDDLQDWVVRSGGIVALRGEPIVRGSTELFSDAPFAATFFWHAGNTFGEYVVGGTTSSADVEADAVLVLNGTTVVARQGDPVDLDGNGAYDDDVFIDIFNNDDGFLTDDGLLYLTADTYDSALVSLGQMFLVIDVDDHPACPGDVAPVPADGTVEFQDLLVVLAAWGPCPAPCETSCAGDVDGNCIVGFDDLLLVLSGWGACP
jgi:hypothetical protein